jgi:hypothetical protein
VASSEVLHEGVTANDNSRGAVSLDAPHRGLSLALNRLASMEARHIGFQPGRGRCVGQRRTLL